VCATRTGVVLLIGLSLECLSQNGYANGYVHDIYLLLHGETNARVVMASKLFFESRIVKSIVYIYAVEF